MGCTLSILMATFRAPHIGRPLPLWQQCARHLRERLAHDEALNGAPDFAHIRAERRKRDRLAAKRDHAGFIFAGTDAGTECVRLFDRLPRCGNDVNACGRPGKQQPFNRTTDPGIGAAEQFIKIINGKEDVRSRHPTAAFAAARVRFQPI